ncbi:cytochrome P450 2J6 [Chanos chanos]|uniref:Cytochrome P450 2J6 n=1 Tax=Chanos chanos TaxID=29144 RepID=A0A6J2WEC5_CHACN|nr:cytochrome P450 2J6-like [Chanos chanos]
MAPSSSMLGSSFGRWLDIPSFLVFIIVFLVLVDFAKNRRPKNFPPGPLALPFFGNMLNIDFKKAHLDFTKLAEAYGDVYSVRLGGWIVVLNGFKTVKEALVNQGDSLEDRPQDPLTTEISGNFGVISTNGYLWRQQRRFALLTLKNFGVGKRSLEFIILEEFSHLSKEITNLNGKPFNPHLMMNNAVSNIICSLVFGHRFQYSDKDFQMMMQLFDQALLLETSIWARVYNSMPGLMSLLPGPHQTLKKIWETVKDFLRVEIEQHKKDRDPEEPRDYIDCYLNEIAKNREDYAAGFSEENLVMCTLDLFVAGSETTSTTLRWALLYMIKYPEIQEKVQAEIDRVIGQSRQPSMADRANLPYTDAVLHEIQRIGNIVPLSLARMTTKDVRIGEHVIPKGTEVIPNLTSVMFDKNEWATPHSFNPEHFLNKEGKFVKHPAFMPFSAGKRVCLGESLARMELFLFFTSLMQKFTFTMPAGERPMMGFRFGITLSPQSQLICATLRHQEHN